MRSRENSSHVLQFLLIGIKIHRRKTDEIQMMFIIAPSTYTSSLFEPVYNRGLLNIATGGTIAPDP